MLRYFSFLALYFSLAAARTSPPAGAKIVRSPPQSGEFKSLKEAVAALPNDSSAQTIFVYPGEYPGQVLIQRLGSVTIYGYSDNDKSYASNQVTFTASVGADQAGNDDKSGTLQIHTDGVKLYNVNIVNGRGKGIQAIALSNYGNHVGVYGKHVYLKSYIEGATDFIFGQKSIAYLEDNTLGISGKGYISASGRTSNDDGIYLFNQNTIVLASGASKDVSTTFGRPWGDYARVIFKNTRVNAPMQTELWSVWSKSDPHTDHVTLGDFGSSGSGIPSGATRPSWAPQLTADQARQYTLSSIMGGDTSWIDSSYLM